MTLCKRTFDKIMTKGPVAILNHEDIQKDIESRIEVFRKSRFFYNLGEPELAKLAVKATPVTFKKGEYIIREQEVQKDYLLIKEGMVKVFNHLRSGRNFTVSLLTQGDSIMAIGIFAQKPVWSSAQALNNVTVLLVNREDYIAFVHEHTQVLLNYIGFCQDILKEAHLRLGEIANEKTNQRIVNVLKILMDKCGSVINLTSAEIADLAGTTTETAIRIICNMKKEGIVSTGRGKLTIVAPDRLNSFAQDSSPFLS